MAEPAIERFPHQQEMILNNIPDTIRELKYDPVGENRRLGLISFRDKKGLIYYIKITPAIEEGGTNVAIAPGLSYLRNRSSSEFDTRVIKNVFQKLRSQLKKELK